MTDTRVILRYHAYGLSHKVVVPDSLSSPRLSIPIEVSVWSRCVCKGNRSRSVCNLPVLIDMSFVVHSSTSAT